MSGLASNPVFFGDDELEMDDEALTANGHQARSSPTRRGPSQSSSLRFIRFCAGRIATPIAVVIYSAFETGSTDFVYNINSGYVPYSIRARRQIVGDLGPVDPIIYLTFRLHRFSRTVSVGQST